MGLEPFPILPIEVMSQLVGSQREIQAAKQNKLLPARQEAAVLCSLSLLTEPCGQCWLPWFLSEWGYPSEFSDDVGQPLGQPAPARLLHMERSGQQVVEGAVAHGHHGAGEADDIVGHAEVWCWQVHQQRLRVQAHKIAGAIRGRKPGEWKKERGGQPARDHCFVLTRQDEGSHSPQAVAQPRSQHKHTHSEVKRGLCSTSMSFIAVTLGTRALSTDELRAQRTHQCQS